MKAAVIGSRTIVSYPTIERILKDYSNLDEIVTSHASGVDGNAVMYAYKNLRRPPQVFAEHYSPERNHSIIDSADMLIAICDGDSDGTKESIDYAVSKKKLVHVWDVTETSVGLTHIL